MNSAWSSCNGALRFFCWISAGVLQGCPLSGLIFVLVLDPLLNVFSSRIDSRGLAVTRACADDIGAAIADFKALAEYEKWFSLMSKIAGLCLKPKKCVLIPTASKLSLHLKSRFRDELFKLVPAWGTFVIAECGKYLGFWLGPAASEDMCWMGSLKKWRGRAAFIGAAAVSPTVAAFQYNARAITVLPYVGTLLQPPARLREWEVDVGYRVLRMPGRTLAAGMLCRLGQLGGLSLRSAWALCWATNLCASQKGALVWQDLWAHLASSNETRVSLAAMHGQKYWAEHWIGAPFIAHLRASAAGLPVSYSSRTASKSLAIALEASKGAGGARHNSPQMATYNSIVDSTFEVSMDDILRVKLTRLFQVPPETVAAVAGVLPKALLRVGSQQAVYAIRFIFNGWTTAHRMHSEPLPCVFCGRGSDSLSHYIACDLLRFEIEQCRSRLGTSANRPRETHVCRLWWWGLGSPAELDLSKIIVATQVYCFWRRVRAGGPQARLRDIALASFKQHGCLHSPIPYRSCRGEA